MSTNEQKTDLDDSFFESYAKKIQEESQQQQTKTSSFAPREYDEIAYAGLEPGVNKVYRIIGAPPGSENMGYVRKDHDPILIMMAEVKDDDGKKFNIKLPQREDLAAKNHIVHRLYDRVTEATWVNKKKIFVNENKFPELYAAVTKTGYTPEKDGQAYQWAGGLKSSNIAIFNVIDRQDNWCVENKHTKIIARNINVDDKGRSWPTPGLKAFGFINKLGDLINKYKNYEKYDVAIKRTGDKQSPFELKNASIYKEKGLMEELKNADGTLVDENIIVVGPLTSEEIAYEKYNLTKLFQPTSYTKLLKRIPSVFKLCDSCLGTKFYDELVALSENEKKEWEKLYANEGNPDEAEETQAAAETVAIKEAVEEKTVSHRKAVVGSPENGLSEDKIALLKGWSKLTETERALIKDVKTVDNKVTGIVWVECEETENVLACDCGAESPESFTSCPVCAASFI